jgi:3'(2'), 5'-bisphosphate nucleotidase
LECAILSYSRDEKWFRQETILCKDLSMNNNVYAGNLITAVNAAKEAGDAIIEVYNTNFSVEHKEDKSPLTLADKRSHEVITRHLSRSSMGQKTCTSRPVLSEEGKHIPYEERKHWEYFWLIDPLDGTREFIKRNGEFTVNIALIHDGRPVLGVIYAPVLQVLYFAAEGIGAYKSSDNDVLGGYKLDARNEEGIDILKNISQKLPLTEEPVVIRDDPLTIVIVASRSHLSKETEDYIDDLKQKYQKIEMISVGSSLKLCFIAEGRANVYPRFGPTMEWDTAAGQAIVEAAGGRVVESQTGTPLRYNKENLINPWFISVLGNGI